MANLQKNVPIWSQVNVPDIKVFFILSHLSLKQVDYFSPFPITFLKFLEDYIPLTTQ